MTSKINETTHPDTLSFPCAMKSKGDDRVVLFTAPREGMVIHAGENSAYPLGHSSTGWAVATDASQWTPFKGTITITC